MLKEHSSSSATKGKTFIHPQLLSTLTSMEVFIVVLFLILANLAS